MTFDLYKNAEADKEYIRRLAEEQVNIAGTEIKYFAVDLAAWEGHTEDSAFMGESGNITFLEPFVIRGILIQPPEAAKMWAAMGLFTMDNANISFVKRTILNELGRRPLPRDRIVLGYNESMFELSEILEEPPQTLFEIFYLNIRVKKIVESYEDPDTLFAQLMYQEGNENVEEGINTILTGGPGYTSAMIEVAQSGTGLNKSEDDIFGRY